MSEPIHACLQQLYDDATAQATYTALMERIGRAQPQPGGARFSERDVFLITYGDTLRDGDAPPLQVLHRFAVKQLKDVFSHVHILPFYPFSSDDGFAVKDFYAVNPALGTWADVTALRQDFALMFDAVFNHMSAQSEWFQRFLAQEPEYTAMFVTESPETDLSAVTRPRTSPLLTPFQRADGSTVHVWTTFSADQVDINVADPPTLLKMIDVLLFYVERGATVVRLDAIAYLWKTPGTTCIHLPQTHAAIRLMRAVLDAVAPQTILITETNVPHAENVAYFGSGHDEAQMVYNFTLPPLLFHTMLSGDTSKLRDWVNTLETPSDATTFFNFTASHDGIGIRPVEGILSADELAQLVSHVESTGGRVSYKTNSDGSQSIYELNVTYVDAITDQNELLATQAKRFLVSQAIALALAGVPAVYVHSLLGSRNDLDGMLASGHSRRINRAQLDVPDVESALADEHSLRSHIFTPYLHMIRVRRAQPAFHPNAAQEALDVGNSAVLGMHRTADEQRIVALHNVTNQSQSVSGVSGTGVDCLTGEYVDFNELMLTPYQVRWVVLG